eukprot:COSAG01_NODE_2031_length_8555_cov_4.407778_5_plen_34_part_00
MPVLTENYPIHVTPVLVQELELGGGGGGGVGGG